MRRRSRALLVVIGAAAAILSLVSPRVLAPLQAQTPADTETRALWVLRATLTSRTAIDTMVASARAAGFNTLIVQVAGQGEEPAPPIDPLALTIERAHAAGLAVHAWVNVNLVAGANELPASRDHVVYRHPEWLMVPRSLAATLATADPTSPQYFGRLSRHARGRAQDVDGLYISPISPAAANYTAAILHDLVERYAVDGVYLDHARYPAEDFDYSRDSLNAFRQLMVRDLSYDRQQDFDSRRASDPLVYTQAFPERWQAFRADRLSSLLGTIRSAVKSARPAVRVSAAVDADATKALATRLQDWRAWLDRDIIDIVCPILETADATRFATQMEQARGAAGTHPVWAGIGAARLSSAEIVANAKSARRIGVGGIIVFSYDSLTGPTRGPEYLTEVGRALFLQ